MEEVNNQGSSFYPIYLKIIAKLKVFQDEALKSEILIMVTMLHPNFQNKLIQHCWPEIAHEAKSLLEQHLTKQEFLLKENTSYIHHEKSDVHTCQVT